MSKLAMRSSTTIEVGIVVDVLLGEVVILIL